MVGEKRFPSLIPEMQLAREMHSDLDSTQHGVALTRFMDAVIAAFTEDSGNAKTNEDLVRVFMRATKQEIREKPGFPAEDVIDLRRRLIKEETQEFMDAIDDMDFIEAIDALGDILYVALGSFAAFGVDAGPIMEEIHRSNMTKVIDGSRCPKGKIPKGPDYEPPDLDSVLKKQVLDRQR